MTPHCWALRLPISEDPMFTWCCKEDATGCHAIHRQSFDTDSWLYFSSSPLRVVWNFLVVELFVVNVVRNAVTSALDSMRVAEMTVAPLFHRFILKICIPILRAVSFLVALCSDSAATRIVDVTGGFLVKALEWRAQVALITSEMLVIMFEHSSWFGRVTAITCVCIAECGPCMPGYGIDQISSQTGAKFVLSDYDIRAISLLPIIVCILCGVHVGNVISKEFSTSEV